MSRPIIGKVVPAPGTGFMTERPIRRIRLAAAELAEARKQRDEAVGLLKMWRKQRSVASWGAIEETTDAFLRGIDQENKAKP